MLYRIVDLLLARREFVDTKTLSVLFHGALLCFAFFFVIFSFFAALVSGMAVAPEDAVVLEFERAYGAKPSMVISAPGRVNLIGEHIDYSGYGVLPAAIEKRAAIATSWTVDDAHSFSLQVEFRNVDSNHFSARNLSFVDSISLESEHSWINYLLAAAKLVLSKSAGVSGNFVVRMMVGGNVPYGSGLSSSSALSCAAVYSFLSLFDPESQSSLSQIAEYATQSERLLGMAGGGMDQAISCLAQEYCPMYVAFEPSLSVKPVKVPDGGCFFVCNTCVASHKAQTAKKFYNYRVCECRFAAAVLCGNAEGPVNLKYVQERYFRSSSLKNMMTIVDEKLHAGNYSLREIADVLGFNGYDGVQQCFERFCGNLINVPNPDDACFALHDRAAHVYSEAARVLDFIDVCNKPTLDPVELHRELGKLMDASHASNRDLYECSCEELDLLTRICREEGAWGARLTGAGWGGAAVAYVDVRIKDRFFAGVGQKFYRDRGIEPTSDVFFATNPSHGIQRAFLSKTA
eukprot:ANDGO_05320.mRNA.1 Galactokinase